MNVLPDDSTALRRELVETARAAVATGLSVNASGNASARCHRGARHGFLVTPSGLACDQLDVDDIVFVDDAGAPVGSRKPSTEWHFHSVIYANRPDVGAVVHTHSPHATALACHRLPIPAFHYMVAVAGGPDIRCAPYATFGTQELSDRALEALDGRKACLLSHHGMIAFSETLAGAFALAVEVETLSAMYWRTLQVGEPSLLPESEMRAVLAKFETYRASR